jgi:hypothetical protein
MEKILERLDQDGGELESDACGHKFRIAPGSRQPAS